ncbi:MAG: hypothetical protein QF615_05845 [Planctomycetota bacterium]|mgnify:CR=1 FL=1|jgi:hypothetical protein|nr:hypothetical protein [Planctomycetota bacterium]
MGDDASGPGRKELEEIIAYALWRRLDLRPRKRSLDDARIWARAVVSHLELCGVTWGRKPPIKPHSTHG